MLNNIGDKCVAENKHYDVGHLAFGPERDTNRRRAWRIQDCAGFIARGCDSPNRK